MMFKSKEKAMVTFADGSGHVESIQIIYDPASVSYERLFEIFGKKLIRLIQTVNSVEWILLQIVCKVFAIKTLAEFCKSAAHVTNQGSRFFSDLHNFCENWRVDDYPV
jgi:hypothetical protein